MVSNTVVGDGTMRGRVVLFCTWTGGRVRRINLVLDVVPRTFVFLVVLVVVLVVVFVVFFVFFVVVDLFGLFTSAVFFFTGRHDLDSSRVLVGKIVVVVVESTRVVVDSNSLPESDCNVSVALDMIAALGRRGRNTRGGCAGRRARR